MKQKAKRRIKQILYFCLFLITMGILVSQYRIGKEMNFDERQEVMPIAMTGTYQPIGSDEEIAFTDYSEIEPSDYGVIIHASVTYNLPPRHEMMIFIKNLSVQIIENGSTLYQSMQEEITRWDSFIIGEIKTDDDLIIVLKPTSGSVSKSSYVNVLERLCIGSKYALLMNEISKNTTRILVSIICAVIGLVFFLLGMGSTLQLVEDDTLAFYSCGVLLMMGGVCLFIDYDYITLIFTNSYMVNVIDFVTQLLICDSLLIYIRHYITTQKFRMVSQAFIYLWTALSIAFVPINMFLDWDKEAMVSYEIPLVLFMFIVDLIMMVWDYVLYHKPRTNVVIISGVILVIFTAAEMIYYYLTGQFMAYLFLTGLVIFSLMQCAVLTLKNRDGLLAAQRAHALEVEQARQALLTRELENELAQKKTAIMLSQIQPHFLYNALNSIRVLCTRDGEMARTAIEEFAEYLRGNMDVLEQTELIPFEKELEHVRHYLYIELLRFGDEMQVKYDLQAKDFLIPPLSLQTMVENAIKHGVRKKEDDGIVQICSRETGDAFIVCVEDDGVGFDVTAPLPDDRAHIGIANTRKRLEELSHGSLIIESEIGRGTRVTIRIPK